jgi:hypothetical protein
LWTALHALDGYLAGQGAWLVNYAKRQRTGLKVGTAITEGTANFLVNRRMNTSQQMRLSGRGADLLFQVRWLFIMVRSVQNSDRSSILPTTHARQRRSPPDPQFRGGPHQQVSPVQLRAIRRHSLAASAAGRAA